MAKLTLLWAPTMMGRLLAMLSYVGILSIVPLVISGNNSYIQFHARQGIVLWLWELLAICTLLFPVAGTFFFQLSVIICTLLSVVGMVSALLGRAWQLPVVSRIATIL